MTEALPFVTDDDADRLRAVGETRRFQSGDVILAQGSPSDTLFILRQGFARVRSDRLGPDVSVDQIAPGEPLGAISFLEGREVGSAVVAEGEVEVEAFRREALERLFAAEPALAARFYQSLAAHLASRLRHTLGLLPPILLDDPGAPRGVPAGRPRHLGDDAVSPAMAGAVELFRTVMLSVDRGLAGKRVEEGEAQRQVTHACEELLDTLAEQARACTPEGLAQGAYVFRETFPLLMKSRFIERAVSKPLGYAGDYATIEIMYCNEPTGEGRLGPLIDRWALDRPAPRAVRERRSFLTGLIGEQLLLWRERMPMPITSLGSGPAREVLDLFNAEPPPNIHATCIDIDAEALAHAAAEARRLGVSGSMTFIRDNLIRLSRGVGRTKVSPQRVIYSVGLIDYLSDDLVVLLLNWIHEQLLPGGVAVLGNFDVANPDRAFMEHILEWSLIHRSPEQLKGLFGCSSFGPRKVDIMTPTEGVQLFARCTKVSPAA